MKVKLFEAGHEKDLEKDINSFLSTLSIDQIIDVRYQMALIPEEVSEDESNYAFSAMVLYASKR